MPYFKPQESPEMRRQGNLAVTQETAVDGVFSRTYVTVNKQTCHGCRSANLCVLVASLRGEPFIVKAIGKTYEEMVALKANCVTD